MDKLLYYRNWSSTILRWWMDRLCVEMEDDANAQQIKTNLYQYYCFKLAPSISPQRFSSALFG